MGGPPIVAARRAAERLMVDACTVRRVTGEATDPDTGSVAPTYDQIYTGKCKVQAQGVISRVHTAGEHQFVVQHNRIDLPAGSAAVIVGDVVDVTASVNDPALVGRRFRVIELLHKSFASAQRLGVEEVTA
jgi:hypothetical protein